MSREVCGICWCPYDEDTGECGCPSANVQKSTLACPNCASSADELTVAYMMGAQSRMRTLNDEIIAELWHKNAGYHHHFARAIERWLKGEK